MPKTIQCSVICELSCTYQSIVNIVMSITNDSVVCFNYFSFLLPPAARAGGFACGAWPPAVIISVQIPLTW